MAENPFEAELQRRQSAKPAVENPFDAELQRRAQGGSQGHSGQPTLDETGRPAYGVGDFIERIPTIVSTMANNLWSGDNRAKLDILQQMTGPLDAQLDAYGNIAVQITPEIAQALYGKVEPGQYYLNRPGASPQDIADVMTSVLAETAGGVGGLGIARRLFPESPVMQAVGTGAGMGVGSLGQDVAAVAAGSQQGLDPGAALVAGLFGLAGEGVGQVVSRYLMRPGVIRSGELTPAARDALRTAGLTDEQIGQLTPDFLAAFQNAARRSLDADGMSRATVLADARTLPTPVQLSRGDVSRDVAQQAFEDAALKGARGKGAQEVIEPFRLAQNRALQENVTAIQGRLGNPADADSFTPAVAAPGEGMAAVQARLLDERNALKATVDAAYEAARNAPRTAFDVGSVRNFADGLGNEINRDFMGAIAPDGSASRLLEQLRAITSDRPGGRTTGITVRAMEAWVQRVNTAIRGAEHTPEGAALSRMKALYERYVDEAIDSAWIRGDAEAIDLFRNARSLRRELAQRFESNNIVSRIIEVSREGGELGLKLQPQEALNLIFTASGAGGKTGAVNALKKLKSLLSEESAEWLALREEAFIRLMRNQPTNQANGAGEAIFSGASFNTNWMKALRDSPEVMRTLFSGADLALMDQFRRVALAATTRVPGAVNTSASGLDLARATQQLFGTGIIGNVGRAWVQRLLVDTSRASAIRNAIETPIAVNTGLRTVPPAVAAALGGQETTNSPGIQRLLNQRNSGQP
jgi:hypothetical protein